MSQPFRKGGRTFASSVWPGLSIRCQTDRIVISSPDPLQSLSNAVHAGGFAIASRFVNWQVPIRFNSANPETEMRTMLERWGYSPYLTLGLITAASLKHASVTEEIGDRFAIVCCTTAGTGNAARAGVNRPCFSAYSAGTINTFLLIDGRLTSGAMVNAVITAAEAKAAALQDLGVADPVSGLSATGTTTDAVVVGVSQSERYSEMHAYAGTATSIGDTIGRIVYASVCESVRSQSR